MDKYTKADASKFIPMVEWLGHIPKSLQYHLRKFFLASCEVTLARTAGCLREAQGGHEARRAGKERGEGIAK